jgi:hypothetical protein
VQYDPVPDMINGGQIPTFYYTARLRAFAINPGEADKYSNVLVKVSERRLKAVTYTNSYKANPFGMGERTAFAMTFTYEFKQEVVPGIPHVSKSFTGKVLAFLDPADGVWKIEQLELGDNGGREYEELIRAR